MSCDTPDDTENGSADGEGGDEHLSRVIEAVRTLPARLATLNPVLRPEDACYDFAKQMHSLAQFTEALEERLGDSADLDFMAQDEFIRELAEEAGNAVQSTRWGEHKTPLARIDAISTAWDDANDAAWTLHTTLTEVL